MQCDPEQVRAGLSTSSKFIIYRYKLDQVKETQVSSEKSKSREIKQKEARGVVVAVVMVVVTQTMPGSRAFISDVALNT